MKKSFLPVFAVIVGLGFSVVGNIAYATLAPAPSPCDTVGSPFITLTQHISNDPDSGNNGNWATDAFTENVNVWLGTDGVTYCANANTTNGTFVTTGPNSPEHGVALAAGTTGTFTGGENYTIPSSEVLSASYNTSSLQTIVLPDSNTAGFSWWVNNVFPGIASGSGSNYVNTYSLTYVTPHNGTWTDADPSSGGDQGDITGPVVDVIPPVVTVTPAAGSVLSGTETFNINVTDNNPLDPTKNTHVWVYLYNATGTQEKVGANVDLSNGTGTFTVDTTKIQNGDAWLDVGQVFDAAGNPSGPADNYFKNYIIENNVAPPIVTVTPSAGSTLSGIVTFTINISSTAPLDPTKNTHVWVYLYNATGTQESQGASVNLSSGTGTFTVDTTRLNNGDSWLDVGQVFDAFGTPSGLADNYFKNYDIENSVPSSTPSSVYVHIAKYIDGVAATAANASGTSFPMASTWTAANLDAGAQSSGNYDLGTDDSYQAVTSPMGAGANYTTNEDTAGAVVGASCSVGDPFALTGYSTGTSFAAAASSTVSTTTPNFTGLTGDEYVIVWNINCLPAPTLASPSSGTITTTAGLTSTTWNSVTDPAGGITYIYQSSLSSSTDPDGSFASPAYTSSALTATMIPTPGTPAGVYYWHVQAMDADGNVSPWSDVWSFTVDNTSTSSTSTLGSDDTLSALDVSEGILAPAFDPGTTAYTDILPFGTTILPIVTATTTDPNATDTITQATSTTGTATVAVTAQDGSSTQDYTVTFSVAAAAPLTLGQNFIGGSSGGHGDGGGTNGGGQVLGASTTSPGALSDSEQQQIALEFKTNDCTFVFNKNLHKGMTNSEVKNLQTVLNYSTFTQVTSTGPGSPGNETTFFGVATKDAVIAFQNIFATQILAPLGLTAGTGYVGPQTRGVLNELCSQ